MSEPTDRPSLSSSGEESPPVVVRRIEIDGKIVWQVIGAVLVTLVLLWALDQASTLVAMVAIAFFFSLALDPGVRWFVGRYGWRRGSATGVVYLLGALFVVLMVVIMIPALTQLAQLIGDQGATWIANLQTWLSDTFGLEWAGIEGATSAAGATDEAVTDFSSDAFGNLLDAAVGTVAFVFNMATVAMFAFYFTADAPRVQRSVLRLFSPRMQERIGWTWDQAIVQTGGYFYSRMLLMLINFLGFFFTMVLVGLDVPFALALALFGSFVSVFIPVIGTYIGGAVPVLLSLAIEGWAAGLIVLGYVLVYQQIENYWLSPKLSAKTMELNAGISFGAALAGGAIAGPMGAFTALPVAALITSFMKNYLASHEVVYQSNEIQPAGDAEAQSPIEDSSSASESQTAQDD